MTRWKFEGEPFQYAGGADPSADVSQGVKFVLQSEGGETTQVNVEAVNMANVSMSVSDARAAVSQHLDDESPPRRIVMDREGTFRPDA